MNETNAPLKNTLNIRLSKWTFDHGYFVTPSLYLLYLTTGTSLNFCPPLFAVKQIIAIVKPFLVEEILDSLRRAPLEAVEVREVKGYGKQKSYLDQYTDTEYSQAFLPKVEIILWVAESRAEEVIRKLVEVSRTGRMGDGKIFVLPAMTHEQVMDIG